MSKFTFEEGKYTVTSEAGKMVAYRYDEAWRDLTGDKLIGAMLSEIEMLTERATASEVQMARRAGRESMTYQLPEPEVIGVAGWCDDGIGYTADQMQAAYQAGEATAREDLTIAYMSGYHKGRDSMKAECVKVCEKWHDSLASEPEMLEIAEEIRGLK